MLMKLTVAFSALALAAASPSVMSQAKPSKEKQASSQAQKKDDLAKEDQKFWHDFAQANMAEVEAGKLAQQKAKSDEVKKFGEHMVQDHGKMLEEQQKLAKSKNRQMPKEPSKHQQANMKKLQDEQGEQFDRAFMSQMVKDHEQALKLTQDAAKNAKDPELKAMAQKAAPEIEKHLQMAKQTSDKASAGGTAKSGRSNKSK